MEKIENLKEKKNFLAQISSTSQKILYEFIKYDQCDILKSENNDLKNTLEKFTKESDDLNLLIENKRASYNKADLRYETKKCYKFYQYIP